MYRNFLSGESRQVYPSAPNGKRCNLNGSARSMTYRELFSVVTVYNTFFVSSSAMPAGAIFSDQERIQYLVMIRIDQLDDLVTLTVVGNGQ